jgi:hypothetical protein
MRPLFVFCADLHLEDGAWTSRLNIYGDAYYSFQQIVDYCVQERLPLILGGDVLEKKNNAARPIAKLCESLSRMQEAGLAVYYIQGNHEYDRNAPWLSVHSWPAHIHKKTVEFAGVKVYGLDWLPRGDVQAAFKDVPPDTKILITHQVWKDFMGSVGRTECELTDVHHAQTVLAGDFHVTSVAEGVNAQGQPVEMLSPGSTAMQDISESPEKFFFVICVNERQKIVFSPRKLKTRQLLTYTVKTPEQIDELCAGKLAKEISSVVHAAPLYVPPELAKPLVRVRFDKQLADAYLRIMSAVADTAHLFCDALPDKHGVLAPRASPRAETRNDLVAALMELLGEDSDEYKFAQEVLAAANPKQAAEAHFYSYVKEATDAASTTGSAELGSPPSSGV